MSRQGPKLEVETIRRFDGLDTEAHPAQRPDGMLQVDEGSSHEQAGVWRPRRGWVHDGAAKHTNAISMLVAIEFPNGDFVGLVGEGTNLQSESGFDA